MLKTGIIKWEKKDTFFFMEKENLTRKILYTWPGYGDTHL